MFRNSLSVPSMENNPILPFIMRVAGLVVKYTAKIHAMNPSIEDHIIYFLNFYIHSTVFLRGKLSYLPRSKTSITTLEEIYEIYLMIT